MEAMCYGCKLLLCLLPWERLQSWVSGHPFCLSSSHRLGCLWEWTQCYCLLSALFYFNTVSDWKFMSMFTSFIPYFINSIICPLVGKQWKYFSGFQISLSHGIFEALCFTSSDLIGPLYFLPIDTYHCLALRVTNFTASL